MQRVERVMGRRNKLNSVNTTRSKHFKRQKNSQVCSIAAAIDQQDRLQRVLKKFLASLTLCRVGDFATNKISSAPRALIELGM